jgi:hypothetical protein
MNELEEYLLNNNTINEENYYSKKFNLLLNNIYILFCNNYNSYEYCNNYDYCNYCNSYNSYNSYDSCNNCNYYNSIDSIDN